MSNTDFLEYVIGDVFAGYDGITSRAMFGGFGLYSKGEIFGIIVDDTLYLKAHDKESAEFFKERGGEQFTYTTSTRLEPVRMPYWSLPADVFEDEEAVSEWFARAGGK